MTQTVDHPEYGEVVLPDGYDLDDVTIDDEYTAFAGDEWEDGGPFNPQNGRWYNDFDPGVVSWDSATGAAGLRVNCAYRDCDGFTTAEVDVPCPGRSCSECGAPMMGREQFTQEHRKSRQRRQNVAKKTKFIRDDLAKEMDRLVSAGCSTVAAMDYLMCSVGEIPYEEWAEARGVEAQSVKRNIKRVANALGETVTYKRRGY